MPVRFRTSAVVLVAAAALATAWALAAAVQPATHRFVKGEHFRYSSVLTVGLGPEEGIIRDDGPTTMTTVEEIHVDEVSASGAILANHLELDKATDMTKVSVVTTGTPGTTRIRASLDGTWRYSDGRIAENFVTWDPVQLGAQRNALSAGQHWHVENSPTVSYAPSRAVVRVVAVGPDNLALHVEGVPEPSGSGAGRSASRWFADVVFEHGIVRELHRVAVQHMDRGPGARGVDARFDRRVQLVSHTAP